MYIHNEKMDNFVNWESFLLKEQYIYSICVKYGKYFSYSCTFVCILESRRRRFYFFRVCGNKWKSEEIYDFIIIRWVEVYHTVNANMRILNCSMEIKVFETMHVYCII